MNITIEVSGDPKGQPRPRAFARNIGGRAVARVYDAGTAEGWKSCIAAACRGNLPAATTAEPVGVAMLFRMRRPRSHYGTGRKAGELKASAPIHHTQKPDVDNLAKAALDVLTTIGLWHDDAQCIRLSVSRHWADGLGPGMTLVIETEP